MAAVEKQEEAFHVYDVDDFDTKMVNDDNPIIIDDEDSDSEIVDNVMEEIVEAEMTDDQKLELAESLKNKGNTEYVAKHYFEALGLYTQAIDVNPANPSYYGNRAATYMMLYKYKEALEDAKRSVALDDKFLKGYLREAKCYLALGHASASVNVYLTALKLDPDNKTAKKELELAKMIQTFEEAASKAYSSGDHRKVVYCMDRCLEHAPSCSIFKVLKAESLTFLKRFQEAQEIVNDVLRFDEMNADAIYVRGLCLYYQDNVDRAFQHFQHVLRLAPDCEKAKTVYRKAKNLKQIKEDGNQAFKVGKMHEANSLYTKALQIDPNNIFTNAKLHFNRATVNSKLKKYTEAVEDCSKAIELDDTYLKAYLRRAKCYQDLELHDEAVRDYEKIYKMNKSQENRRLLQEAKLELKKSKRKDYYKILGIGKDANEDEIKKAYRKKALSHHPDRHSGETEELKKDHEKKFKEIGEAYTVLSDPKKKARYDSGQDLEDLEGGGYGDIDPNLIFQSFFGGGGSGFSFGGGGHPGFGHSHGGHGAFPGGFSFQFG